MISNILAIGAVIGAGFFVYKSKKNNDKYFNSIFGDALNFKINTKANDNTFEILKKTIEKYGVDKVNWNEVQQKMLDEDLDVDEYSLLVLFKKYEEYIDWSQFPFYRYKKFVNDEEILEKYKDKITWRHVPVRYLKPELVEKYKDFLDFSEDHLCFSEKRFSSEKEASDFVEKYKDKISPWKFSQLEEMDEEVLRKNIEKINFKSICFRDKLSEKFITDFKDKIEWKTFWSRERPLHYLELYKDKLDWKVISEYQKLPESIITKYKDQVDWKKISRNQKLTSDFIDKNIDKIDLCELNKNYRAENLSNKIKNKIKESVLEAKFLGKYEDPY